MQRRGASKQKAKPLSEKHPELRKLERELERLSGFSELRIVKIAHQQNLSVPHIQGLFKAKGIKLYVFNKWTDTDGSEWADWYPKDPRREHRGFARYSSF